MTSMNKTIDGMPSSRKIKVPAGFALFAIVCVTFAFLALTREPFSAYNNLYSILFALSIDAIAIIGFTYVMVLGEIDLSVGAVYALTGTLTGWFLNEWGFGLWPAMSLSLIVAGFVGYINGFLVTRFRINSLMLTIGTLILVQGLVGVLATDLVGGTYPRFFRSLARTRWFGINATIIIMVATMTVIIFMQYRSTLFRKIYLIGENPKTAHIYGIRSDAIKIGAFIASSLLAGFAGIFTASRLTHADIEMGVGLEFTFVTAAILGGASLYGGRGGIGGSVLGLLFLALILNGLVLYNVNPLAQQIVVGFLLISAVILDLVTNKEQVQT